MKELNNNEMQAVAGAGLLSFTGGLVGAGLGSLVDVVLPGESHFVANTGRTIGRLVGTMIENPMGGLLKIVGNFLSR